MDSWNINNHMYKLNAEWTYLEEKSVCVTTAASFHNRETNF